MKEVKSLQIPDVKVIWPNIFQDHRGYFLETYNSKAYEQAGIDCNFIQDNQSFSEQVSTIRGMHFQIPPFAQAKLVRVLHGAIIDVAFDLRKDSPTRHQWCSAKITAEEQNQIFVPAGFAHGFITLEPNTVVHYKVDNHYSKEHEQGFIWNDEDANIDWGSFSGDVAISEKDGVLPILKELPAYF
ncbi:MAG: dTDP-4-dehydrorhamnose 3,5-epimerase [Methyloligellaceae bacterium]